MKDDDGKSPVEKVASGGNRKRGAKFMRKPSLPNKMQPRTVATYTGVRRLKPNMSRRTRDTMLYAFPSFDRCDSLLFFPSSLARHLNSGDIPSVAKLFLTHMDKNCSIDSFKSSPHKMTVQNLVRVYEILNELQPDKITCMHSTRVEENQIKSVGFMKFTNCRSIYNSVASMIKDTHFSPIFKHTWENHLRYKIEKEEDLPLETKERYLALVETGCDLVVYGKIEVILTVDDLTKKVSKLTLNMKTTSVEEVKYDTTEIVE